MGLADIRVGWVNHVRYAIAGWTGKPITFKPATFYLEIVSLRLDNADASPTTWQSRGSSFMHGR